jgi:hypothetical protein
LPPWFFFQTWWFEVNGFGELVAGKLSSYLREDRMFRSCIDLWQSVVCSSRQFLKGWGANLGKERKSFKAAILSQIESLDK